MISPRTAQRCLDNRLKAKAQVQSRCGLVIARMCRKKSKYRTRATDSFCFFIYKITAIRSFGHGLHTYCLTAVPRSTQPSDLRGK